MSAAISFDSSSTESLACCPDSVSGFPSSPRLDVKSEVAAFASSTADESDSLVGTPPPLSESAIDESEDVQVVIDEQSPSAHSSVGVASLLLSFEPQPATMSAVVATSTAARARFLMRPGYGT